MLGHGRRGQREQLNQLAYAKLAAFEGHNYPDPVFIGQGFGDSHETSHNIIIRHISKYRSLLNKNTPLVKAFLSDFHGSLVTQLLHVRTSVTKRCVLNAQICREIKRS